jgi:hypothetical protein
MGTRRLRIGALLTLLETSGALSPPRTGHIGNWGDIARGRAGPMDFNKAICARGLGYPLVYCFTQTEGDGMNSGDWVYMPGSLTDGGRREALPLYTWNGKEFVQRDRQESYLCPLIQTERNDSLVPLIEVHWTMMQKLTCFRSVLEAEIILAHKEEVCAMLQFLIECASSSDNPRRSFQDLISHVVAKDGTVKRCTIRREGTSYRLDNVFYTNVESLVEATLFLFWAVTTPRTFFEQIRHLPNSLPVLSNVVTRIFTAHFLTHYPGISKRDAGLREPFNLHLHWGARSMAGFPPRRRGYFVSRSKTRSFRLISDALLSHFPEFRPICVALLPAAIFMLCPTSAHPQDSELLTKLFKTVERVDCARERTPNIGVDGIESAVTSWKLQNAGALSSYFLGRFLPGKGILSSGDRPLESEPVEPDGFRNLTLQQACAIVGALTGSNNDDEAP